MKKISVLLFSFLLAGCWEGKAGQERTAMSDARTEIADLVNNWAFYRDQEAWSKLGATFHDEGTISLSWFDGPHKGFVAASQNLAKNNRALLKHYVGVPRIRVEGDRALSEVNVTIMVRVKTPAGEIDTTSYARFIDRIEKRDGKWKLLKRTAVYEKDRADPVDRPALPEAFFEGLDRYPAELRFLASSLDKGGVELSKATVLDKGPELAALHLEGEAWLAKK
ncbi:PEP2-like protein [Parvibaculum lavamentivorans DS-1]|uniref:PEP2-like protein n=2 Tax=Parvibaculum lavamentivorans TaxID=256618 RepID=A7HVX6_PARL1|nr:PEP2-like protein [Parvibaculum lavamentivorans DS-1]